MDNVIDRKLAAAQIAAESFGNDPSVKAVLVGGSLTAGFGNTQSDVDLFVVLADGTTVPPTEQRLQGEDRIDIEWYSYQDLKAHFELLNSFVVKKESVAGLFDLDSHLDLASRFITGVLVSDDGSVASLLKGLLADVDHLRILMAARWSLGFGASLEDFRGAVDSADLQTAALVAQTMLLASGKSLVNSIGDVYFGRKWVYQQLRRSIRDDSFIADYWAAQSGRWLELPNVSASDLIRFSQSVTGLAQVVATRGAPDSLNGLLPSLSDKSIFAPQEDVTLFALSDRRFLLHEERGKQFVVGLEVAAAWICAGAGDHTEVVRRTATLAGCSEERADVVLRAILAKGLISPIKKGAVAIG